MTPSVVTLMLHTYVGMLEYNALCKTRYTIGTEAILPRTSEVLNGVTTIVRSLQTAEPKMYMQKLPRMLLWRAIPYVLHYAYRERCKYISIERHFPISSKFDGQDRFDLSELCSPLNYGPVAELALQYGMWGDYFSFTAQDYTWLPSYDGRIPHTFDWDPVVTLVVSGYVDSVLADNFPYSKIKNDAFKRLAESEDCLVMLALMLGCFYQDEMLSEIQIRTAYSYTEADYYRTFHSDLWNLYRGKIIEHGFRALYKSLHRTYKVSPILFPYETEVEAPEGS